MIKFKIGLSVFPCTRDYMHPTSSYKSDTQKTLQWVATLTHLVFEGLSKVASIHH